MRFRHNDPEKMTPPEVTAWMATAEYNQRRLEMADRIAAGEQMTVEYVAHQLGIPFMVLAGQIGVEAANGGDTAIVDTSEAVLN